MRKGEEEKGERGVVSPFLSRFPQRMRTARLWKAPEGAGEECAAAGTADAGGGVVVS